MNDFLKRLFFVRKCIACGMALPDADKDTVFCEACFREYQKLCRDICPSCEKTDRDCRCVPRKLRGKVGFAAHLFAYHDELSRKLIYSFKLKNYPFLQRFMAKELADLVWTNLNEDNKVSLFVRAIPLDGSEPTEIIINKNA